MVCAFIVMKCEGFSGITDLADYLDNNRLIAHYCGFEEYETFAIYWTYDRFLKKLNNGALKEIMSSAWWKKLYRTGHCGRLVLSAAPRPLRRKQAEQSESLPETNSNREKTALRQTRTAPWASI